MFNGIIYNRGVLKSTKKIKNNSIIELKSNIKISSSDIGGSIACDGVCLTLTKINKKSLFFYLSSETLQRTTFKYMKVGNFINLEKSLIYGKRLSGHYTQGHVDLTGQVSNIIQSGRVWTLQVFITKKFHKYLVEKGSISINGVSLTISKINKSNFEVTIIPHTLKLTNLINLKKKDFVNIELDIFSKYILDLKK